MHLPFVSYMEPKINGTACRNTRFTALSEALHVLYTMKREPTQVFAIWKEPLFNPTGMLKRNVSKHNRADQLTCMSRIESPLRCNQSLYLYVPYAWLLQSWQAGSHKARGQGASREIDVRTKTKQPSDVKLSQLLFFYYCFYLSVIGLFWIHDQIRHFHVCVELETEFTRRDGTGSGLGRVGKNDTE